jgi:hypothetical protein
MALNPFNLGTFNSGTYTPLISDITAISNGQTTTVTTSDESSFVVGQEVQFFIPFQWGIQQLNLQTGYVTAIGSSTQFTVNIDSTFYDAFITPSPSTYVVIDPAQVAGIGDANTGYLAPGGIPPIPMTIPGAFENQPP